MSHEIPFDSNSPAESTTAAAESLGAWLAQTRTGFNAELREVARHLGLNPTIIEAIENDDYERLGPPVFVRGYLSRYARLLNLPEAEVLDRYRLQSSTSVVPPLKVAQPLRRQTRVRDLRGVFYLLLLIGIAWTAVQNLDNLNPSHLLNLWSDGTQKNPTAGSTPPTATSQTQYPFQAEPANTPVVTPPPTPTLATDNPPSSKTQATSPAPTPAPSPPVTPAATPPPQPQPASLGSGPTVIAVTTPSPHPLSSATTALAPGVVATTTLPSTSPSAEAGIVVAPGEAKLLLEFSNECWVEVKDAQGNVLANGLMKANSTRAISGAAPFKVTLGNAPATRIMLDDRIVDTEIYVPRRGTVSRFTLDRGQP